MEGALVSYAACRQLSQLLAVVAFFHVSEFVLAVATHGRSKMSMTSLLISKQYVIAMACALVEYAMELALFPELKEHWWISNFGLVIVLIGEIIRKAAILTAGRAFTHKIKTQRENSHHLITRGIYGFVRHPGYCGFFLYAVGTQVMLCSPISIVVFAAVTWRFFSTRIRYEEFFLKQFFGVEYAQYAARVPSGLPFIK
ncbi:protein-S-isoprenylcysteine O-methyltransferase A-like [Wolffia australiana]